VAGRFFDRCILIVDFKEIKIDPKFLVNVFVKCFPEVIKRATLFFDTEWFDVHN